MASLKDKLKAGMQEAGDMVELTKGVGKRAFYNLTNQDDKKVELPPDTQKRMDEQLKPKKKVTNGPSVK